jgi:hypothetical protein
VIAALDYPDSSHAARVCQSSTRTPVADADFVLST